MTITNKPLKHLVNFRLTVAEHDSLRGDAASIGVSVSELARRRVTGDLKAPELEARVREIERRLAACLIE